MRVLDFKGTVFPVLLTVSYLPDLFKFIIGRGCRARGRKRERGKTRGESSLGKVQMNRILPVLFLLLSNKHTDKPSRNITSASTFLAIAKGRTKFLDLEAKRPDLCK